MESMILCRKAGSYSLAQQQDPARQANGVACLQACMAVASWLVAICPRAWQQVQEPRSQSAGAMGREVLV